MLSRATTFAALLVMIAPAFAQAADPFDMKGRWVGKTHSIVAGKGGHWPTSTGTIEKPGLFEKDIVWEVKGQQDTRFWGVMTMSGGNERTEEPFIGELYGKDGMHVITADTDGFQWGEIDGDTFNFCYAHAGKPSSVVSCTVVKRAR
ncbi:MAG: hypothetical protein JOY64_20160 [Alphaproteobacteria bacterium]|nr:hypothetical protein [Alphaproteobacteria bacterium]MBV8409952.1 hypothetical protein [Alphaproteobacteria bacterium]